MIDESKSTNSKTSKSKDLTKQKLSIVKKELIKERDKNKEMQESIDRLNKKVNEMNSVLAEERQKYTSLYEENNELTEQNMKLMQNVGSNPY